MMADFSKATARPWVLGAYCALDSDNNLTADTSKRLGAALECQANAALIVQAVNSFDPLLVALKECSRLVQSVLNENGQTVLELEDAMIAARAAIKLAEGK
jgi:hypothetical protein